MLEIRERNARTAPTYNPKGEHLCRASFKAALIFGFVFIKEKERR